MKVLELATHCFWHFVGIFAIGYVTLYFLIQAIIRLYRMVTVMVRGWPPAHLDADGDHIEYIKRKQWDNDLGI